MKIGVISDTHIPVVSETLPDEVIEHFKDVDLILHAGDLVSIDVLESLNKIAKTIAVSGNMDQKKVRSVLPEKTIVEAGIYKIGLIHGGGAPWDIVERISKEFDDVDVIVFGHTHQPMDEVVDGVLFFNPGTPTDYRFSSIQSVGILDIEDDISTKMIHINKGQG